ncbi:8036_t:CDS:10 [Ambispora gerdemannii]|uniref:Kinesin-like protein n=1 Tax=Ambispora gerdemannii TaxID=144530 RepID=A0A9N8YJE8_9GLOM|nr:8036_t:CDS:10 [Ambispora gerdemannii]
MSRNSLRINTGLKKQEVKEANIQVAVRCRGINRRDSAKRRKESEFSVDPSRSQIKSLKEHGKTYTFDRVFGEKSTQADIFKEIVAPMLVEVLSGYNCSILAYGMTGTGKTYTMEGGDPSTIPIIVNNCPSQDAGIIPRTLIELFNYLSKFSEYSVKLSFIELYNEQPRDLLSTENSSEQIKIYDDARKGGVVIQNLEEVLLKDAMHGINILKQGSERRRKAVTNYNARSSRSHCVFTITIHIKETTTEGEELLKVGKFNLVDLAGSENIGRSGAEDAHAKEAGSINKSLLTLGRVIDKLVSDSAHVPYRDSNLTRILQDSLGGRTKTCIIATISPSRNSYDETLSTLEYAHRAKQIKNKPEINQKLTKTVLLKEYVDQIERLKADLQATRDRNGIFLSPESWRATQDEIQDLKASAKDLQDNIKQHQKENHELHDKIGCMELVEISNRKAVAEFQGTFLSMASGLEAAISKSKTMNLELNEAMHNQVYTFSDQAQKNLIDSQKYIDIGFDQLDKRRQEIEQFAVDQNKSYKELYDEQTRLFLEYRDANLEAQNNLNSNFQGILQGLRQVLDNHFSKINTCHEKVNEEMSSLTKVTQKHIESQNTTIELLQNALMDTVTSQQKRRELFYSEITDKINLFEKEDCEDILFYVRFNQKDHLSTFGRSYELTKGHLTSLEQEPNGELKTKLESIQNEIKSHSDLSITTANSASAALTSTNDSADKTLERLGQEHSKSLGTFSSDIKKTYSDMRVPLVNIQNGLQNSLIPFEKMTREKAGKTQRVYDDAMSYMQQTRNEVHSLLTEKVKSDVSKKRTNSRVPVPISVTFKRQKIDNEDAMSNL